MNNHAPVAKGSLNVSIRDNENVERIATDLASDQDSGDTLSLVGGSAISNNISVATVSITGGKLKIDGVAAGTTTVMVKVTDGKTSTDITIPVTVTP
ncbi:hypothetical protein [Brevibacillus sp. 1238]|uniref:hypothetical protein n=1 Tax=Brevibacillus sp. 1238 TaxID=2940565 RepID=UPI0024765385|nr:hypothetical protein [Brevibacillus sp. 1238]MDH6350917.1 hypothetical protein [Brevibacillus sp. 1238]